jgi:DNA-binding transcriptional LysR family regulator
LWAFDGPGLEELAELRHITVARHGGSGDEVDDLLAEHGLKRRVAFTVPTFDAAVAAVAGTRFVTVAPSITLRRFQHHHLHLRPLPFRVEPLHAVLSWHVRTDREPAHAWLRDRVAAAVRDALG